MSSGVFNPATDCPVFEILYSEGDQSPSVVGCLKGVDLTGSTIQLNLKRPTDVLVKVATFLDAVNGLFEFTWDAGDLQAGVGQLGLIRYFDVEGVAVPRSFHLARQRGSDMTTKLALTVQGQTFTFGVPVPIGVGEANTATNVGGEAAIFRDKVGTLLNFRSVKGVNGTTATVVGDTIEIDASAISDMRSETLSYTDVANEVLGPLAAVPALPTELNLFVLNGLLQDPVIDFTVREVVGGTAPGWYICVSSGSTPPGGGSFFGGINPSVGISTDLAALDLTRVIYAV